METQVILNFIAKYQPLADRHKVVKNDTLDFRADCE